jgi:hypothetical protein
MFPDSYMITPAKIDFSDQRAPTLANQNTRIPEHHNTNSKTPTPLIDFTGNVSGFLYHHTSEN